jgi:hypothetical protein
MSLPARTGNVNFPLENPARPQWDTDPVCNLWVLFGPGNRLMVNFAFAERNLYDREDNRDEGA